jgi:mono/diheme cytochrome c family protein
MRVLKWIGIVLGSLIGLMLVMGVVLFLMGNARLNKTYDFPLSDLEIPTDAESIAYGEHRVESLCAGCHGDDLGGRKDWFDGGPLGNDRFSQPDLGGLAGSEMNIPPRIM